MPAPLRPETTVSPGAEPHLRRARRSGSRAARAGGVTRTRRPALHVQADRHQEVEEARCRPPPRSGPGAAGEISFSSTSSDSTLSRPSRRNSGLKPISSGSPWNGTGSALARLADVGRRADTVSSPSVKRQPQRRVLLRQQRDAAHDLGDLAAGAAQLVLVGVGQQLAVVRELAVDQPRREHDAVDLEDDLVRRAPTTRERLGAAVLRRCASAPAAPAPARWPRSEPSSGASSCVSLTDSR